LDEAMQGFAEPNHPAILQAGEHSTGDPFAEVAMSKILRDIPIAKQITKNMHNWELRREKSSRQASRALPAERFGPYIAVSRERGSGGTEISQHLAAKLGWKLFDRNLIEAVADRTHTRADLVARFDEHCQSATDTYLRNLFTGQRLDNTQYLYHLSRVLLSLAGDGRAVILGRGAHLILPAEAGLRVRVTAPLELRCRRVMQELNCGEKQTLQLINTQDKERKEFLQHHFHAGADEASAYDVVINTAYLDTESAVEVVMRLAEVKLTARGLCAGGAV
jgi:cytidylate kinase